MIEENRSHRAIIFVLDVQLGGLARLLRILGFNAWWKQQSEDWELLEETYLRNRNGFARFCRKVLLTQDRHLAEQMPRSDCYRVMGQKPQEQLKELTKRFPHEFGESLEVRFLTRCLECNLPIFIIPASVIKGQVPRGVSERHDEFFQCPSCLRVFWKGTHFRKMLEWSRDFVSEIR